MRSAFVSRVRRGTVQRAFLSAQPSSPEHDIACVQQAFVCELPSPEHSMARAQRACQCTHPPRLFPALLPALTPSLPLSLSLCPAFRSQKTLLSPFHRASPHPNVVLLRMRGFVSRIHPCPSRSPSRARALASSRSLSTPRESRVPESDTWRFPRGTATAHAQGALRRPSPQNAQNRTLQLTLP